MTKRKSGAESPPLEKPLTEVELELMNRVWDLGQATVKEVQAALPADRDLAYTTVATVMKILEQKGVVRSAKGEKAHVYTPILTREDYEGMSLRHLADHVFRGDASSMVMRLLEETRLSERELAAIRKILGPSRDGTP